MFIEFSCPASHPYSVDSGGKCCSVNDNSCPNSNEVDCEKPPCKTLGEEKNSDLI